MPRKHYCVVEDKHAEHIVFPEIDYDKVDEVWGLDIIICTTAPTDAEAKALLKHFNMPFNS